MRIAFSPYELRSRTPLGKSAGAIRAGALLRFRFEDGTTGYADCHPWPELGDEPLSRQLELLAHGSSTPLTRRSLASARIDARFRSEARSAFSKPVPPSHLLLGNALEVHEADLERWAREGFSVMKLKAGNHAEDPNQLRILCGLARKHGLKLRIDFNERLSEKDAFSLFDSLGSADCADAIDFVEDPIPFERESWARLKERFPLRLALDRKISDANLEELHGIVDVAVIKPALSDPRPIAERASTLKLVFTTYLDHPVGSAAAAWSASEALASWQDRVESCGLLTHLCYEETSFSRRIGRDGARWIAPAGTGMGFDEELGELRWKELA